MLDHRLALGIEAVGRARAEDADRSIGHDSIIPRPNIRAPNAVTIMVA
jgi:hypothetical protein